jgi:dCTP deaminase
LSLKSVVEGYALEIAARASAGRVRCERLATADFVSNAPRNLIKTLQNIFEYLEKVTPIVVSKIDWTQNPNQVEKDINVLRVLDYELKDFASHIRYVESARTDKLPWQIIPSFEKMVEYLKPGAQVMLRPMWHYNYATIVSNIRDVYLSKLQEYEFYLPEIDVESSILSPLGSAFHIISFPALERDNILLHSLIGHEIGHLIAQELVESDAADFLDRVQPEIEKATDDELKDKGITEKDFGLLFKQYRAKRIAENSKLCLLFWSRALEEILSDIVGAVLFGPAALFSTLEIAIQIGFDLPPESRNNYYPPWRTRIRHVFNVVEDIAGDLLSVDSKLFKMDAPVGLRHIHEKLGLSATSRAELVNERVKTIRDIINKNDDLIQIRQNPFGYIAYNGLKEYIVKHTESIKQAVGRKAFTQRRLSKLLPVLIERLDAGITPNSEHDMPSRKSARVGVVEVLNSAWYHKTSLSVSSEDTDALELLENVRSQRNRLTLKSIEYTFLSDEHPPQTIRKKETSSLTELSNGVLTADDLQDWMEKDSITQRLIVTPLFDPVQSIGKAAVDVRLGTEFILFKKETFQSLDVTSAGSMIGEIPRYRQRVVRRIKEPFILHPGQLVIGSTMEYIQIPPGLMAYVIGKSTWGRTGLIIATATKVDPGFKGCITLEIVNEGEVPLVLVPGIPIAQLVLHCTTQPVSYDGVYSCPIGPEFPRFEKLISASSFWLPPQKRVR